MHVFLKYCPFKSHQCILLLFDCKLLKVLYNGIFSGLNFLSGKLCITVMRLVILDNYDLASEWAAKYICNRIIQFRPGQDRYFTLGLPTGNAPFFSILGTQGCGIEGFFLVKYVSCLFLVISLI